MHHIAALWLFGAGWYILGLMFHAFGRHKGLGLLVAVVGLTLIGLGLAGYTATVPGVTVNPPSPSVSHNITTPSPSKT